MFDIVRKEMEWGGETLTLETGKVARQADGSVVVTYGETTVMANVTFDKQPKVGLDFFPLTVHYQEKVLRRRQDPGRLLQARGAPDREGNADLAPDRPADPPAVRPGFKNETQVVVTVLSHDMENDPDIIGMIAASAALTISGVPFRGPIGAARVGFSNGEYVLNPKVDDMNRLVDNPDQR